MRKLNSLRCTGTSLFLNFHFHIPKHERIVTHPKRLAAGSGNIPKRHFFCYDIRELLLVRTISHLRIEIGENGRPLVILRMVGIIDMKIFNDDPFRHIAWIAEVVLA